MSPSPFRWYEWPAVALIWSVATCMIAVDRVRGWRK
jgi:hypothetical protein